VDIDLHGVVNLIGSGIMVCPAEQNQKNFSEDYSGAVRLDGSLLETLRKGALRTPHKKQEVDSPDAPPPFAGSDRTLSGGAIEEAATRGQGMPSFND
jgi:hypothetical protein